MSSFAGLSTALSGLVAQRYGLETTGQNVANANTPGYTRQRAVLEPTTPQGSGAAVWSRWDGPGTGVAVTDLQRLSDELVNSRVRHERSTGQYLAVDQAVWSRVEVALGEPGDTALSSRLSAFWASWQDLANSPDSMATRQQVLQAGAGVTDSLSTLATSAARGWADQRSELGLLVAEVNATASAVADLNGAVRVAEASGGNANELADRRDALLVRLAELTGGNVRPGPLGTVDVFVGGNALVRGTETTRFAVDPGSAVDLAATRAGGSVGVVGSGGNPVDVPGGRIGALLVAMNETWPGVMDGLDATAADVAAQVNAVHSTGTGRDGVGGRDFFTGTTAATLRVALTDPAHVAAAAGGAGPLDGSLADALGEVGRGPGSPDAGWRSLVADVGSRSQAAGRRVDAQAVVVRDVVAARESASGVDIDEELTNMVMFQRAYEGAARMLTAVDEALDTLINRTGLVGR